MPSELYTRHRSGYTISRRGAVRSDSASTASAELPAKSVGEKRDIASISTRNIAVNWLLYDKDDKKYEVVDKRVYLL